MSPPLRRCLVVLFGSALCLLLLIFLSQPAAPPAPPAPPRVVQVPRTQLPPVALPHGTDPESLHLRRAIVNGERIYQQLCYHCHGRQGKGDNNDYMASIGHKPADHTDLEKMQKLSDWEFFTALRDGVKDERGWLTMPPWESVLSAQEMWDVITYVRRLPLRTTSMQP